MLGISDIRNPTYSLNLEKHSPKSATNFSDYRRPSKRPEIQSSFSSEESDEIQLDLGASSSYSSYSTKSPPKLPSPLYIGNPDHDQLCNLSRQDTAAVASSSQQATATQPSNKKRSKTSFLYCCFSPDVTTARQPRRDPPLRRQLKQELNAWIKSGTAKGERKRKAKTIILKAFDKKSDKLDLNDLSLRTIPKSIGYLTQVKRLDLSNNLIEEIPDTLANMTELKKLELSCNRLFELPNFIENLVNLESLCINRSSLKQLPDTIGNLNKLRVLEIANNYITIFPETIGNLSQLTTLIACDNRLQALPNTFGELTRLARLLLNGNPIAKVPESVNHLPMLRVVGIGGQSVSHEFYYPNMPLHRPSVLRATATVVKSVYGF